MCTIVPHSYDSAVYMLAAAGALIILAAFDITEFVDVRDATRCIVNV